MEGLAFGRGLYLCFKDIVYQSMNLITNFFLWAIREKNIRDFEEKEKKPKDTTEDNVDAI